MARGKRPIAEIDSQLAISDFMPDVSLPVVQSYTLINGKQSLKLNSAKLVRAAIMQLEKGDSGFKPYIITMQEIAKMLNISASNTYRDIDSITDDIIKNPVEIKQNFPNGKEKWIKIPWVSRCEYNSDIGLLIRLNDDLAPLLLNLQEFMSQYSYEEIAEMRSVYSIRIFELLMSRINQNIEPNQRCSVAITLQEIREACDCVGLYSEYSNLKLRVIDPAVEDINKNTSYDVTYRCLKASRKVVALEFSLTAKPKEVES